MSWKRLTLLIACLLSLSLAGCAADTKERASEYFDDTTITTKVKTKLFDDPQTSGFAITVKTYKGTVQLSGFVTSDKEKDRAGELAKAVPGVKDVKNDLIVKSK
ncbi:MAG: BON domain-containing protein [Gammaproteobacteria bacterium]|nr:MAG: BON domain-containing protein [Gammaproteobacteria bacterium]